MQETLRLIVYTIIVVILGWFVILTFNDYRFMHTNIDPIVNGKVPIKFTDIGDQCGDEYVNSNELVEYKLTEDNQIAYLCPLGISPIRTTVTSDTVTDVSRALLPPRQRERINQVFPPDNTTTNTTPPSP